MRLIMSIYETKSKPKKKIMFVHIPKTGGTTVTENIKMSGWPGVPVDRIPVLNPQTKRPISTQHAHAEIYLKWGPFDSIFTVVRHPIHRFISQMNQHRKTKTKTPDYWANHFLDAYEEDPYAYDNHLRPQVEYLCPEIRIWRFESATVFDDISKEYGMVRPNRTLWSNRSHGKIQPKDISHNTMKRIIKTYKRDFKELEYTFDEYL